MDWSRLKLVALGGALTVAAIGVGALLYPLTGLFDTAATVPHSPLVAYMVHNTMIHSVRDRADGLAVPARMSAADLAAGFCSYDTHCVACHGAAGVARAKFADGMYPTPPYLISQPDKWNDAELFSILRRGIKMTAMPSWQNTLSPQQTWQLVAFLKTMPKLPVNGYAQWRRAGLCRGGAPVSLPRPAPLDESTLPGARVRPTAETAEAAPSRPVPGRP
ncbi:cytochrome c [Sphingomonas ginkgonis]|uniref:Cytochrome c n=1 Tax=Sphingomonas ginkgonis TaxID=2315330 RepID=A0A429VD20_9SPHN|nr:cytochrome c [Sphingomonas ginkgonis]RST31925.1 cytochrome c [Sphingomonas ginkgonis]